MGRRELSYLQLSGRAQTLTNAVLPRETLERMAEAQSAAEALRTLAEGGVAMEESQSAATALEEKKASLLSSFSMVEEGKTAALLFRIPYDCHNAKVLLKAQLTGVSPEGLLSRCGSVPLERLRECIGEETGAGLPAWLRLGLDAARRSWTDSRSVQLLDVALDRACFAGLLETAHRGGSTAAEAYVRLCIDGINLQTVLRMKGASAEAVEEMLLPGGQAVPARILDAAASGSLGTAFSDPLLRAAAEQGDAFAAGRAFAAALKVFADRCRRTPYGPETLLGFFLLLELHSAAARLILTEKARPKQKAQGENRWAHLM